MKMKFLNRKVLMAGMLMTAFTFSCTDLDEELFSEVAASEFGQTEEEVAAALAVAYTGWTGGYIGATWTLSEMPSDEAVVPTRGQDWFDNGNWQRLHLHSYGAEDDAIKGTWPGLFGGVNNTNRLLKQFESAAPGPERDAAEAELKSVRALLYFWLLDLYGNVPIQDDFDNTDVSNGSGSDYSQRTEVYNWIVSELETALPLLSDANDVSTYGRMNEWAARALLAKLYLNKGVYTSAPSMGSYITGDLTKAKQHVDAIINDGPFSLESDYFVNFDADNSGSVENILVIVYDQVFSGGMNLDMRTLHYGSQDTYNFTAQPWNGYCTLEEFYNSFDDDDKRKGDIVEVDWPNRPGMKIDQNNAGGRSMFIVGPQFKSDGSPVTDASQYDEEDGEPLVFNPKVNELGPKTTRQAGARIGKYEFEKGATPNQNNDVPIFRYGDILLMKAEIEMRQGGDAAKYVQMIRDRANLGMPGIIDEEFMLAERGREVAFEYWRRNDLIRFGKYNDAWWGKEESPDGSPATPAVLGQVHVNVFPIPRDQLEANSGLKQNPGY